MKKIISIFIVVALSCVFALPCFADNTTIINNRSFFIAPDIVSSDPSSFDNLSTRLQEIVSSTFALHNATYNYYFAYVYDTDKFFLLKCVSDTLVYDAENNTFSTSSSLEQYFAVYSVTPDGYTVNEILVTGVKLPDNIDIYSIQTNMNLMGIPEPFDPNNPPAVFNYSVDKNNFVLENNKVVNVLIDYTPEYLSWCTQWKRYFNVDNVDYARSSLSYDFCVYVSPVKPTDSESLIQSMVNSRYVNLNFTTYVYEGGVGSAVLNSENEGRDVPTSQSGKSPWTTAEGVCICNHIEPHFYRDTDVFDSYTFAVPIYLENIKGYDTHIPLYICVFAAESGGSVQPNHFDYHNLQTALEGHNTPNDTYTEFFEVFSSNDDPDVASDDLPPDYSLHTYYFPFEDVSNCVGDGFQGDCVYKPQNVRGKDYNSDGSVFGYTNKSDKVTPERLHDIDMDDDEWVKPEDYSKWQYDHYNRTQYSTEFDFDTHNLKEIFDKESNFFEFMTVCLKVLPDYFINIFWGFLVALFGIIILKRLI